jgi:uncharacterized membrane protein
MLREWRRSGRAVERRKLQAHVLGTYISLRHGMVLIGVVLPFAVMVAGCIGGVGLQESISAYYWAASTASPESPPSRDWFVGSLFAIAACLYLYKGFTTAENVALNLAALFAVGVALFPTPWDCRPDCGRFSVHGTVAILLFVCLLFVVWFCAKDTLTLLSKDDAARYRKRYNAIGFIMLASPLTAFLLNWFTTRKSYILWVEAAGIWAFAAYWYAKSRELKKSSATTRAVRAAVKIAPDGKAEPAPEDPVPPEPAVAA